MDKRKIEAVLKHLAGKHNQKNHGSREEFDVMLTDQGQWRALKKGTPEHREDYLLSRPNHSIRPELAGVTTDRRSRPYAKDDPLAPTGRVSKPDDIWWIDEESDTFSNVTAGDEAILTGIAASRKRAVQFITSDKSLRSTAKMAESIASKVLGNDITGGDGDYQLSDEPRFSVLPRFPYPTIVYPIVAKQPLTDEHIKDLNDRFQAAIGEEPNEVYDKYNDKPWVVNKIDDTHFELSISEILAKKTLDSARDAVDEAAGINGRKHEDLHDLVDDPNYRNANRTVWWSKIRKHTEAYPDKLY